MSQTILYLCDECKREFIFNPLEQQTKHCIFCGSLKVYRSAHHQRYAKKSRNKVRWSYKLS